MGFTFDKSDKHKITHKILKYQRNGIKSKISSK